MVYGPAMPRAQQGSGGYSRKRRSQTLGRWATEREVTLPAARVVARGVAHHDGRR
jgi:hypothetical protein